MPAGDVYQWTAYVSFGDQTAVLRRYYQVPENGESGTGATQALMVANLDSLLGPPLKALMSGSATYKGSGICRIWPRPQTRTTYITSGAGDGTVVGDQMPRMVCGLVSLRTFFAGRKYRGRMYVPFAAEADNAPPGKPSTSYLTRLDTLGGLLISVRNNIGTAPNQTTLTPVLAQIRYTGTAPNRTMLAPVCNVYEGFVSRTYWATQRRRGDFGAGNVSPI